MSKKNSSSSNSNSNNNNSGAPKSQDPAPRERRTLPITVLESVERIAKKNPALFKEWLVEKGLAVWESEYLDGEEEETLADEEALAGTGRG